MTATWLPPGPDVIDTDEQVASTAVTASRHDDGSAALLFRRHYAQLAGWCRRMVNDEEVAHDIASEAFTRLLGRWTSVADPRAYLYTTALNLIRDRWRRNQRERVAIGYSLTTMKTEAPPAPELRMLVDSLPKRLQEVVVLHYFADLSVDSTAAALGIAPGTVKRHLYDARARLAAELDEAPTPRSAGGPAGG